MKQINLFDGSFTNQKSFTLGSVNSHRQPQSFHWNRGGGKSEYTFYTDMRISDAVGMPGKKVALLIEPPSLSRTHYDKVIEYQDEFDYVLSFWKPYLEQFGDKGLFYAMGGSWIAPIIQGIKEKSKDVCIIVSQKKGAVGHRMRHSTVEHLSERLGIDVFGRGYKPFESKARILAPYRYAIVIESWSGHDHFSEKLIDALSVGCVPIYHGCPDIGRFFNKSGILTFDMLSELEHILINVCSKHDYEMRFDAIQANFEACKEYQCAEDWIYKNYEFLFG